MVTVCRFLPFLAVSQVLRINNLNVVNTQDGFEPRPAHQSSFYSMSYLFRADVRDIALSQKASSRVVLDLPPFLTQAVKTQNPFKGELSHGVVKKNVHQGVQAGCGAAAGARGFPWRGCAGAGSKPERAARWRREFRQGPGNVFPGNGKQRWSEGRIAELERKIGQQALELDFLKGCLQRIEEQRMLQALTGSPRSSGKSGKK